MRNLRFWKRESKSDKDHHDAPVIGKFGIGPRPDVGEFSLPDDPEIAARVNALQKRRESLANELRVAEEAGEPDNQWRRQIALVSEALEAIDRERASASNVEGSPGSPLPAIPVTDVSVAMDPVATVRFRIGGTAFVYAEDLDWAERGTQVARSDLHRDEGDIEALIPLDYPPDQRTALIQHLEGSVFTFATDLRDRSIEGQQLPEATLADLARPSEEYGDWLDWSGHSPLHQSRQYGLSQLREEQDRLEHERTQLLEEEAKMVEAIPVIRRRLADIEQQLAALTGAG